MSLRLAVVDEAGTVLGYVPFTFPTSDTLPTSASLAGPSPAEKLSTPSGYKPRYTTKESKRKRLDFFFDRVLDSFEKGVYEIDGLTNRPLKDTYTEADVAAARADLERFAQALQNRFYSTTDLRISYRIRRSPSALTLKVSLRLP